MKLLTEQQQIDILRNRCDKVQKRIWISSPYIGSLKDIQKIIGGKWLLPSVDCRILTDVDSGFIRDDTFDEFVSNNKEVRSLDSLHAKIYIIDDWCLVTSANLTGTAFLCRYEMGIATNDISEIEKTFVRWWNMAKAVTDLTKKPSKGLVDYQDGHSFKKKFKAPPYNSGKQDKYDAICEKYKDFACLYEKTTGRNQQMVSDGFTLLQEVDYLFNYLYHDHPNTPSHGQKVARILNSQQKVKEIKQYFRDMCAYYEKDPQKWRLKRTKTVQSLLSPNSIKKIGWNEAKEVVLCLHCLSSYPINRTKFLNPKNNDIKDIIDCWNQLLHTGKIDSTKIKYVTDRLNNFGLSSIYELIGWFYPDKYPLMNENSHCGMRFFGYTI
ncbi:MAG: hypothetical protein E7101_12895 [Prevotella ruminicola]|uniref:PLD phosphodiesterase domain-containing protein n=1 Tax=Xylanibacter ruminicola TaxID=839 RepID=A0A9D5P2L1_XYLRU|nr:hypothetical protein [Xylanibacter ruminicola]